MQLVALDAEVDKNTTLFRDLTTDINEITVRIGDESALGVTRARQRLDAASARTASTLIFTGMLGLGVAVLAALVLARQILRPLRQFSQAAQQIGQGNLDVSLALPNSAGREFSLLAEVFNTMTTRLRDLVSSLELRVSERTEALTHVNENLQQEVLERTRAEYTLRAQNVYLAALHETALGLISRLE
jgi:nitrate/nitrite-specific signal transduction histidine kinase